MGKLGGGGLDYDSDLDLVMVYDAKACVRPETAADREFYSKAVEIFTNALSSITREGSLYRVDLRLRPYGSKGTVAISSDGMLEYMRSTAEVWELLAFVMLRPVSGDLKLGDRVETELRHAILNVRPNSQ
jgi:glutamate-ammonia-ligase adenylyltransferase